MPADSASEIQPRFTAYIGLGSNVGDRAAHLRAALKDLRNLGYISAVSSMWQTAPVGLTAQPPFLNAVVTLTTSLAPEELLKAMLDIELRNGRDRRNSPAKGPRTLDLDLLLMESAGSPIILKQPGLHLPHPELHARRFVLAPLAEIAPELRHPIVNSTIAQLLQDLPPQGPNLPENVTVFEHFEQ
jgi:2-amino-4-hydroxy-6-hydroxymethyldihydropteridine diphosphokinase